MTIEMTIPETGESIEEAQIGAWKKSEGDRVDRDEPLVEIDTDKASVELPAPASGVLQRIVKAAGETVAIGDVIALIEDDGAADDEPRETDASEDQPSPTEPAKKREPAADQPKPDAKRGAEAESESEPDDEQEREEPAGPPESVEVRPRLMPPARQALAEHGLRASEVSGTGPAGRVLKEDVDRHADTHGLRPPLRRPSGAERRVEGRRDQPVPMSLPRRRMAEAMAAARQQAVYVTAWTDVDLSGVLRFEQQMAAVEDKGRTQLGTLPYWAAAAVAALRHSPKLNAEVRGDEIVYRNYCDVGVAVSTDRGVVVPVLRDADGLSFGGIAAALQDLVTRAGRGELGVDELSGATFTIADAGAFGSLLSTPAVTPPQSAVLGLHAIENRPVDQGGADHVRPMMYVALTFDRRLIDEREAGAFLTEVKRIIELPARLLLDA